MRLNGFHIEPTNRCVLRCSACERTQFQEQFGTKHWHNQDIDIDALITFMDQDVTGFEWELCGNTGDPIYHPDLPRLVEWIKAQQGRIWLTTNGSYQPEKYWEKLLTHMDSHDVVYFSVDGLPETSPKYRVNSDWTTIDRAMRVAVDSGVRVIWKMIPFAFNEHEIAQVRDLALSRGMGFRLDISDRFTEGDKLKPLQPNLTRDHVGEHIEPACATGNRHYISSAGFYNPCCWSARYNYYAKSSFYKNRDEYDISKTTLSKVMERMQGFDDRMQSDPMPICNYMCKVK